MRQPIWRSKSCRLSCSKHIRRCAAQCEDRWVLSASTSSACRRSGTAPPWFENGCSLAQIVADRWLLGDESTPLRRGYVGTRDDISDDTRMPAVSGFDQKIVFFGAEAAHLGKWHVEAYGADPRCFRQDFQHIMLAKGKAAKAGNRRLLA